MVDVIRRRLSAAWHDHHACHGDKITIYNTRYALKLCPLSKEQEIIHYHNSKPSGLSTSLETMNTPLYFAFHSYPARSDRAQMNVDKRGWKQSCFFYLQQAECKKKEKKKNNLFLKRKKLRETSFITQQWGGCEEWARRFFLWHEV